MENPTIPEEVIWEEHEAKKLAQATTEKILREVQWKQEYIDFLDQESYMLLPDIPIQTYGEADVCIKIAQWRAKNLIEEQEFEDLKMDAYIQLRDILSKLKLENGLLIDPRAERRIIDHYNRPRRLREKFRSQLLDTLILTTIARIEFQNENSYKIRQKIFPYLPPYDNNSR